MWIHPVFHTDSICARWEKNLLLREQLTKERSKISMVKLSWVPKTLHCMCTNTQPFAAPLNWVQSWDGGVWLGRQVARRRARSPTVPTAVQSPKSGITGTHVSVPCFLKLLYINQCCSQVCKPYFLSSVSYDKKTEGLAWYLNKSSHCRPAIPAMLLSSDHLTSLSTAELGPVLSGREVPSSNC